MLLTDLVEAGIEGDKSLITFTPSWYDDAKKSSSM